MTNFILLAVGFVIFAFIVSKANKNKSKRDASNKSNDIVRHAEYLAHLKRLDKDFRNVNSFSTEDRLAVVGDEGEVKVLSIIESIGKGVVYWSVGLNLFGTKCEFDTLVFTPYGVLHVETKNIAGEYWGDDSVYRPNRWSKDQGHGDIKTMRSPIAQALRARKALRKALEIISKEKIPVMSVVVFANSRFSTKYIVEDRMAYCDLQTFKYFYTEYVNGAMPNTNLVSSVGLAKTMSYLSQAGQIPVFFDESLFSTEDNNKSHPH